jgi:hypothetical protein
MPAAEAEDRPPGTKLSAFVLALDVYSLLFCLRAVSINACRCKVLNIELILHRRRSKTVAGFGSSSGSCTECTSSYFDFALLFVLSHLSPRPGERAPRKHGIQNLCRSSRRSHSHPTLIPAEGSAERFLPAIWTPDDRSR